jgi:hypothetical protein
VTGGGNIDIPGGKVTFGFVVQYDPRDASPSGNLTYIDHAAKVTLKATSIRLLYITGGQARITGYATVNGISNTSFNLDIYDGGEPGVEDIFVIQIPDLNDYSAGGVVSGGNIQVSAP